MRREKREREREKERERALDGAFFIELSSGNGGRKGATTGRFNHSKSRESEIFPFLHLSGNRKVAQTRAQFRRSQIVTTWATSTTPNSHLTLPIPSVQQLYPPLFVLVGRCRSNVPF